MRALLLLVVGACGFTVSGAPVDGKPDVPPDMPVPVTWAVDAVSGKAVPATQQQWADFLLGRGVNVPVPNGLWLLQESSGQLADSIGLVSLAPFGGTSNYQVTVPGWDRKAIGEVETSGAGFQNISAQSLPDVGSQSMTIYLVYATATPPGGRRTIMMGGSTSPTTTGLVEIDPSMHYAVTVNGGTGAGSIDHGMQPVPLILKLDRKNSRQVVITNRETIASMPYQRLGSNRGILIGGASHLAADGRWLYMAAWYGPNAEIADADLTKMLKAIGW